MPEMITLAEAVKFFSINRETIRHLVRTNRVEGRMPGTNGRPHANFPFMVNVKSMKMFLGED